MCCWVGDAGADIDEARRPWTTVVDSTVGDVVIGREEVGEHLDIFDNYPLARITIQTRNILQGRLHNECSSFIKA